MDRLMIGARCFAYNLFAGICYLLILFSTASFVIFLSCAIDGHRPSVWLSVGFFESGVLFRLALDVYLVAVFCAQHTLMKSPSFKILFGGMARSIYVASTAIVLLVLMYFWLTIPEVVIWRLHASVWWWVFIIAHWVSWIMIYGITLIMDPKELVGLRQARCAAMGLPGPLERKSSEYRALLDHVRHPCFTCLVVILFFRTVMTLDRFVLAISLTAYMLARFCPDEKDYAYVKYQSDRKFNKHH